MREEGGMNKLRYTFNFPEWECDLSQTVSFGIYPERLKHVSVPWNRLWVKAGASVVRLKFVTKNETVALAARNVADQMVTLLNRGWTYAGPKRLTISGPVNVKGYFNPPASQP